MRLRDRFLQKLAAKDTTELPGEALPESTSTLTQAEELLNAGDEAIRKVLSGNSAEFLSASRQAGGQ
jgi:hypothetical protein